MLRLRHSDVINLEELEGYLEGASENDPLRIVHEVFNGCDEDLKVEKDDEEAARVVQEEREQIERLRRESQLTDKDLQRRFGPARGTHWDDRFIQ